MTRTSAREIAFRLCYETAERGISAEELLTQFFDEEYYETLKAEDTLYEEYPDQLQLDYIRRVVCGTAMHAPELDEYIAKYARGWKFERISRTALAIMRLCMYEVMYVPEIPDGVAINEAVELAKKYEEQETVRFVNGILGSFSREETISE